MQNLPTKLNKIVTLNTDGESENLFNVNKNHYFEVVDYKIDYPNGSYIKKNALIKYQLRSLNTDELIIGWFNDSDLFVVNVSTLYTIQYSVDSGCTMTLKEFSLKDDALSALSDFSKSGKFNFDNVADIMMIEDGMFIKVWVAIEFIENGKFMGSVVLHSADTSNALEGFIDSSHVKLTDSCLKQYGAFNDTHIFKVEKRFAFPNKTMYKLSINNDTIENLFCANDVIPIEQNNYFWVDELGKGVYPCKILTFPTSDFLEVDKDLTNPLSYSSVAQFDVELSMPDTSKKVLKRVSNFQITTSNVKLNKNLKKGVKTYISLLGRKHHYLSHAFDHEFVIDKVFPIYGRENADGKKVVFPTLGYKLKCAKSNILIGGVFLENELNVIASKFSTLKFKMAYKLMNRFNFFRQSA
ncbi:MAG: hypothetical protein ACPGUI_00470 [Halarcobacter sp.]